MLTASTATKETATLSVLQEPLETVQAATGSASPATLHAKLASTILLTAQAASTVWVTCRLLQSLSPAFFLVSTVLTLKTVSVKCVTLDVLLVLDPPLTVSPVLKGKFSIRVDVGHIVSQSLIRELAKGLPVAILVLTDSTRDQALNVLPAPSNVQLAKVDLKTVLLVFTVQSPSTEAALFSVAKTSSTSKATVSPVRRAATDVNTTLRAALNVLMDT